ncbi:MAG: restriction endonuclease [Clostridia bacterium]|nr:restriction endonuclease [Clostridia bacterium]
MSGKTFENFIAKLYKKLGYISINTKTSGDQGIDVIVKKTFLKLGIQTKRYDRPVGNKAVQEAVAGKKYYKLDKVAVITNNYFTRSAKELAKVNGVELIDRDKLKVIIKKAYKK